MKVDVYETFTRDYDGIRIRQMVGTAKVDENGFVTAVTHDQAGYIPAKLTDKHGRTISLDGRLLFTRFLKLLKKGALKVERREPKCELE